MLTDAKVLTINSYYLPEKSRFSLAKIVVDVLTIVLEPVCSAGSNQNLWTSSTLDNKVQPTLNLLKSSLVTCKLPDRVTANRICEIRLSFSGIYGLI